MSRLHQFVFGLVSGALFVSRSVFAEDAQFVSGMATPAEQFGQEGYLLLGMGILAIAAIAVLAGISLRQHYRCSRYIEQIEKALTENQDG